MNRGYPLAAVLAVFLLSPLAAEELPLLFLEDFSAGVNQWEPTDAKAWKITEVDGNLVYENLGGSKYEPPYRSPKNISLRKDVYVSDFVLTARVQTKQEPRGHRDMCLFFGCHDPANFYYVHLGQQRDPHANQIFLVNEAPRIAISEQASEGTPWESGKWHDVKIVRKVSSGLIEIYFDDMEKPSHVAHDKTFTWGRIGIGTFDDFGLWDDVELKGVSVDPPVVKTANPKKLHFEKWTPEFPVPDPVALSFDEKGRAYVTQTQRRKANDLDIRNNTDWIPNDLSFQSIDDKIAFYREKFTEENSTGNAERVEDLNGDGIHDIKDLTYLSERVHLIEDTDGDGKADTTGVYAEQLDDLIGGVAGGVLYHQGNVYVCPVPELVRFQDKDGDGKADVKDVLVRGFGIHLAYAGHDMHGLSVGPDGRLYWSVGDKGIRVMTPDGIDYKYPNQGGVMRCELDGSHFEVYAHGLRNVQEPGFDLYGNLFGVDNDADFEGERERFVYIEQFLDGGWRSNWQYLKGDYNPWVNDEMHVPFHEGQPLWFTPPLSNYENGPAGFKRNPGTALGKEYQDYFFLTSAPRGEQWAFRVKPSGDSFAMVNDHKVSEGVPLVGLAFAPDGALYGVDWGGGYPLNEQGAVWKIDVSPEEANPMREETRTVLGEDFSSKDTDALFEYLAYPDQRIRLKAQFELAERGDPEPFLSQARNVENDQFARIHSIWGMGQLLRSEGGMEEGEMLPLLKDPDPEIRAQALKTLTDRFSRPLTQAVVPEPEGQAQSLTKSIVPLLQDPSQRVRLQALLALGRLGDPAAAKPIVDLLSAKENNYSLTYLRLAGVTALAGAVPAEELAKLSDSSSNFIRACAVVALRRRGNPAAAEFLTDEDPLIAAEAARAIHDDWMIEKAMPELAECLGKVKGNEAFTRRSVNANFRLGSAEAADRVLSFLADDSIGAEAQEAALEALRHWTEPGTLDLVTGRHRPLAERDPSVLAGALADHIDELLVSSSAAVQATAMELARASHLSISNDTLRTVLADAEADGTLRSQALRSLASQEAEGLSELVKTSLEDKDGVVNRAALEIEVELDAKMARAEIEKRIGAKGSVRQRQHAIGLLPSVSAKKEMEDLLARLAKGKATPELQLDIYLAAKDPAFGDDEAISRMLAEMEAGWAADMLTDPLAPFAIAVEGGDPVRGKSVFLNHEAAQCIRCHKVAKGGGSDVGPNLMEIGKKKERSYLLQALVDPQAVVAPGYGTISLTLKDGTAVTGQFRSEKDSVIVVRDAEGEETRVKVSDVAERSPVISTMPPMGFLLKKDEVRDLIAFLASLKG